MNVWSYCAPLRPALSFVDFCAVYWAVLLGRCAALSLPLLGVVLLLRNTVLWKRTFGKGVIWAAAAPALSLGKLAVYYENRLFLPFILWQSWCSGYGWVRYGYLTGVMVCFLRLARRRVRLRRILRDLPAASVGGQRVYLCNLPVSPFAAGVLFPKIVLPAAALDRFDEGELRTVVLHERTHIRRGHLWYLFLWEMLCALLWVNPFLRLAVPQLREDLEHICDAVTIRRGGQEAVSYGRVILRSFTFLREDSARLPAAFAGESDFAAAKERIRRIRDYRPYSRGRVRALHLCAAAFLLAAALAIQRASFPRCTNLSGYSVFRIENDVDFVEVSRTDDGCPPLTVVSRDTVVIDNAALRAALPPDSPEDGLYYILWGGFLKTPGIGGALNAVWLDGLSDGAVSAAAFSDINERFYIKLAKWL